MYMCRYCSCDVEVYAQPVLSLSLSPFTHKPTYTVPPRGQRTRLLPTAFVAIQGGDSGRRRMRHTAPNPLQSEPMANKVNRITA